MATRHGVGSFVVGRGDEAGFRIRPQQLETLRDVIAMLELRMGVETEAAGLAAQRRTPADLASMRQALGDFEVAVDAGRDAVAADFQFHRDIARAIQNDHFIGLLESLGTSIIPRARLDTENAQLDAAPAELPAPGSRRAREHLRRHRAAGLRRLPRRDAHPPGQQPRTPTSCRRGCTMTAFDPSPCR